MPSIISQNQTAYVPNRCVSESGRLIADIICDKENITGHLATVGTEKAFDSLDHDFLICVLRKFGFGGNFVKWVKVLLNNQEPCVLNGGTTTLYFKLEKGARQRDLISLYLFIITLEVLFALIKSQELIKGIEIFDHCFLFTVYADDSTFFLGDSDSVKNLIDIFQTFLLFSVLKPNISKCEIAGIILLKGAIETACGLKLVDLTVDTIKILGVHFSYNKDEKTFLSQL